jgi:hypothetical protein
MSDAKQPSPNTVNDTAARGAREPAGARSPAREAPDLLVTTSPHLHAGTSTPSIMLAVTAALIPAGLWGVYVFGLYSLWVILASVAASLATEYLITRLLGASRCSTAARW